VLPQLELIQLRRLPSTRLVRLAQGNAADALPSVINGTTNSARAGSLWQIQPLLWLLAQVMNHHCLNLQRCSTGFPAIESAIEADDPETFSRTES